MWQGGDALAFCCKLRNSISMKIRDAGGEFELLRTLSERSYFNASEAVIVPVGDDAAVMQGSSGPLVATVDTIVEGRHFSTRYFSPQAIGVRAVEGAVSDLVAMGATPKYILCALILPERSTVEEIEGLYFGIRQSLDRVRADLVGGDTNSGSENLSISVTALGELPLGFTGIRRSGARPGDLVFVTGGLGGSATGLALLTSDQAGFEEVKQYHLTPRCRVDLVEKLRGCASAAIDISDGLSSELSHLATQSGVGITIEYEKLPIKAGVIEAAATLGIDPSIAVLHGGEEFEILFTAAPEYVLLLASFATVIGEVVHGEGVVLTHAGARSPLVARGFVHLR
jgi:thiamine-monophosphate kinase